MSTETVLTGAKARIAEGRLPAALELLRTGRLRHPGHAGIALLFADVLQASGQLSEAVATYTVALRIDDRTEDGWFGAGCAHLALNAAGAAATCFTRAAAPGPPTTPGGA